MILRVSSGWLGGIQRPHQVVPAAAKSASRSWFPLTLMSYPVRSRPAARRRAAQIAGSVSIVPLEAPGP